MKDGSREAARPPVQDPAGNADGPSESELRFAAVVRDTCVEAVVEGRHARPTR